MYWLLTIILPFIGGLVSIFALGKQWNKTAESTFENAKELFGFPSNWSSFRFSCEELITRKTSLWYPIFVATSLCYFISPALGNIVEKICVLFFLFLIFGTHSGLRCSKKALRNIKPPIDRSYKPIVNMFRISLIYTVYLLALYRWLIPKLFYG